MNSNFMCCKSFHMYQLTYLLMLTITDVIVVCASGVYSHGRTDWFGTGRLYLLHWGPDPGHISMATDWTPSLTQKKLARCQHWWQLSSYRWAVTWWCGDSISAVLCNYAYSGGYGGSYLSEVIQYDASTGDWVKTGDLQTPRSRHGVSAVAWNDISAFCD